MKHRKEHITDTHRTNGFTLIEVMVAVLVLSIGLLGIASLQATSLRNNNDASMQTRASYMASDMADRMRANAASVNAYPAATLATPAVGDCTTASCTPTQMVDNDVAEWNQQLAQTLPAGQGTVTSPGAGLFTITVLWDEARSGVTGTGCDPDVQNDLRCLSITTQP